MIASFCRHYTQVILTTTVIITSTPSFHLFDLLDCKYRTRNRADNDCFILLSLGSSYTDYDSHCHVDSLILLIWLYLFHYKYRNIWMCLPTVGDRRQSLFQMEVVLYCRFEGTNECGTPSTNSSFLVPLRRSSFLIHCSTWLTMRHPYQLYRDQA